MPNYLPCKKRLLIRSFMMAELQKTVKTHINKVANSKPTSNELKKNCFTLKMYYLSQIT